MTKIKLISAYLLALLVLPYIVNGQEINLTGDNNTLKVTGTSTLHDWEMEMKKFDVSARFEQTENSNFLLSNTKFTANAKDLLSSKSMMNNKAHEALKAKKHPSISFTQDKPIEINKNQQNYFVPGQLTIAGKTNSVTIPVHLSWNEQNELKVTGDIELKMTDFDMEPPSVMFGSINTDDLVKVSFSISLK